MRDAFAIRRRSENIYNRNSNRSVTEQYLVNGAYRQTHSIEDLPRIEKGSALEDVYKMEMLQEFVNNSEDLSQTSGRAENDRETFTKLVAQANTFVRMSLYGNVGKVRLYS